jgi:uncharacterized protein YbjT (DUF2867 family)
MSITVIDLDSPVLVVGATGTVGAAVLEALDEQGACIRVLVRAQRSAGFPAGVEQVVGDLGDEASLRRALTGVRAALYVSPHAEDEIAYAENFIRACEATGTRIVFVGVHVSSRTYPSRLQRQMISLMFPSYAPKLHLGQLIAASDTRPVMLAPINLFQNDEIFLEDLRAGSFPMPMRSVNRVDVRDVAEIAAQALLRPAFPTAEYVIAGPESLSSAACARIWSAESGRPVQAGFTNDVDWDVLTSNRLSGKKAHDFRNALLAFRRRAWPATAEQIRTTTELLGRSPRRYRDYVAELLRGAEVGRDADRQSALSEAA